MAKKDMAKVQQEVLDVSLSQHRLRLERYERDLREFEERYSMESATFYRRFEAGELGDAMDFFEWAGLYELREDIYRAKPPGSALEGDARRSAG